MSRQRTVRLLGTFVRRLSSRRGWRRGAALGPARLDRGSVTAEAALVLPVLVLLLTVGVGTVGAVTAQLRCIDAAREAARAAARGEPVDTVRELAGRAAPAGAAVSIATGPERIEVVVTAEVTIGGGLLPPVQVVGTAVAVPEPTTTSTARAP